MTPEVATSSGMSDSLEGSMTVPSFPPPPPPLVVGVFGVVAASNGVAVVGGVTVASRRRREPLPPVTRPEVERLSRDLLFEPTQERIIIIVKSDF